MLGNSVELLLVRGAPGVGKSTAVNRLRRLLPSGATIEVDAVRAMLHGVNWQDPREHTLSLEAAVTWAELILASGRGPVVLVDTLSRPRLQGLVVRLRMPFRIATLYAAPTALKARVEARPEGQFKDIAACMTLNAEAKGNRYPHERFFDTTELGPAEVSDLLLAWILEPPTEATP